MPRTVEKRELPWVCMEAAFVEVAQRLMMQSFVMYLLDAWGCAAIWCVFLNALIWCAGIVIQGVPAKQTMEKNFVLGQHRTIRQEVSGRIFVPIQSFENGGILYVFPIFGTAEVEQKDG